MTLDNVLDSLKEVLSNHDKKNTRLVKIVGLFLICLLSKALVLYLVPLLPLVYYCYQPKKADHLALAEWCRDHIVNQVNHTSQLYIRYGYPPHLFLGGLYLYIIWATLLQILGPRWIGFILGTAWITRDQWLFICDHPSVKTLQDYLFPSAHPARRTMVQRALEYQQQYMIKHLDHTTTPSSQPFTFSIYENQRKSPLSATWHAITLPLERTAWTDDAQATVLPKHEFVLPSPVQLEKDQDHKVLWTWLWVDSDWKHDDWIYGNWLWALNDYKTGWTRQRKWTRRAILECTSISQQQQKKLAIDPPPYHPASPRSPLSPQPSLYDRRPSSQVSLVSTKTEDHSPLNPKRSSSRSTRRQAVWKSIVKT